MKTYDKLYIGGEWTPPSGKGSFDVIDASTEELIGRIPAGDAADVDRAVKAARAAFEAWSRTPPPSAASSSRNPGRPRRAHAGDREDDRGRGRDAPPPRDDDPGWPADDDVRLGRQLARATSSKSSTGNSLVIREPVGVVGCITPWNYPLHQIAAKVAPALAAGCTVVLKPSEVAPLSALHPRRDRRFGAAAARRVQPGERRRTDRRRGHRGHPEVDMVSFTARPTPASA